MWRPRPLLFVSILLKSLLSFSAYMDHPSLMCPSDVFSNIEAKYLFIGEDHTDPNLTDFFKITLPILKKQGFTVFFAEYIDSADQRVVDMMRPYETKELHHFDYLYENFYDYYKYRLITQYVLENDFQLIAMDRRKDIRTLINDDRKLAFRDSHMFEVTLKFIQRNPESKIIFYNGSSHSFKNSNIHGPSLYEQFISFYGVQQVKNIKLDHYNGRTVSPERIRINQISSEIIDLKCRSGLYFYKPPVDSNFNFYGFKDNQKAFPTINVGGLVI